MLRTIIIEDDKFQMEVMSDLLETSFPSIKIISRAFNAVDGIEQVINGKPDLVFLDIDLPDKSGFEILKELPDHFFEFIFVTAHERFAIEAFEHDAIGFLLKPVTKEKMQDALNKLNRKRKNQYSVVQVQAIIDDLKKIYNQNQKIAVPSLKEINYINVTEIVRLEADGNYTTIFPVSGKPMLTSKQIGEYEKQLSFNKFYRIHDKHLINLHFVKTFMKGDGGNVVMEDNAQLPVARRRKDEFLKSLDALFA